MKTFVSVVFVACLMFGCAGTGNTIPHDDSAASISRDAGPVLCKDGSTPPCNSRD